MKTLVIIPAYNEARVIGQVIEGVKLKIPEADVVVIDDGSYDKTSDVAEKSGVRVLKHVINRGLGGAIGTGLLYAKIHNYDAAITIDADGQHNPADITKVMRKLVQNVDVVIGSRMASIGSSMPWDRKIINAVANMFTTLLFRVTTTDSQSGFRGFSKKAIEGIHLRTNQMEVSSEIFGEIKRLGLTYAEVPIDVIYTEYSRLKGQKNSNAIPIATRLMLRLFR